jgi:hypothetical protein
MREIQLCEKPSKGDKFFCFLSESCKHFSNSSLFLRKDTKGNDQSQLKKKIEKIFHVDWFEEEN